MKIVIQNRQRAHQPVQGPIRLFVGFLVCCLATLVGCDDTVETGRHEVHPMVETTYEQAIRKSLAEVPGGRLLALELQKESSDSPAWHSDIVNPDGERQGVTLAASGAEPPGEKPVPHPERSVGRSQMELLERAVVLPEDAVRKVAKPDFDKVESIGLVEQKTGEPAWSIGVVSGEESDAARYEVDAVNGEVLRREAD